MSLESYSTKPSVVSEDRFLEALTSTIESGKGDLLSNVGNVRVILDQEPIALDRGQLKDNHRVILITTDETLDIVKRIVALAADRGLAVTTVKVPSDDRAYFDKDKLLVIQRQVKDSPKMIDPMIVSYDSSPTVIKEYDTIEDLVADFPNQVNLIDLNGLITDLLLKTKDNYHYRVVYSNKLVAVFQCNFDPNYNYHAIVYDDSVNKRHGLWQELIKKLQVRVPNVTSCGSGPSSFTPKPPLQVFIKDPTPSREVKYEEEVITKAGVQIPEKQDVQDPQDSKVKAEKTTPSIDRRYTSLDLFKDDFVKYVHDLDRNTPIFDYIAHVDEAQFRLIYSKDVVAPFAATYRLKPDYDCHAILYTNDAGMQFVQKELLPILAQQKVAATWIVGTGMFTNTVPKTVYVKDDAMQRDVKESVVDKTNFKAITTVQKFANIEEFNYYFSSLIAKGKSYDLLGQLGDDGTSIRFICSANAIGVKKEDLAQNHTAILFTSREETDPAIAEAIKYAQEDLGFKVRYCKKDKEDPIFKSDTPVAIFEQEQQNSSRSWLVDCVVS